MYCGAYSTERIKTPDKDMGEYGRLCSADTASHLNPRALLPR